MDNIRELSLATNGKAGRIGGVSIKRKTKMITGKDTPEHPPHSSSVKESTIFTKEGADSGIGEKDGDETKEDTKWLPQWKLHQVLCQALSPTTSELPSGTSPSPSPVNPLEPLIRREIRGKLSSHKSYDQTHGMDIESLSTDTDILYKLLTQKERCYYCHCLLHVLYQDRFDPFQWSLDRIDNSKGHTNANTILACLRCNLRRRTRESKDFYRDRNLRIEKEDIEHV
jgi:hypothetical protein